MGNEISSDEEDDNRFLEEGFNLEDPEADGKINFGTAAPNCQPKHTRNREEVEEQQGIEVEMKQKDASVSTARNGDKRRQQQDPKKMSYIQMAKMGYQELVNAVIRPPRADYKVSTVHTFPWACERV